MAPKPLASVLAIEPYKGGESALPGHAHPIKLSSNENPLGCSPAARAAYLRAAESLALYPDGSAAALRRAIGGRYDLDPARILCGAGSDEIFQMLGRAFLAPGEAILQSQYAFLVYRLVAQAAGARVLSAPDRGYTADVDAMLALLEPGVKLVFLANPNNPTGTYLSAREVRRLHAGLPGDVLFVLDTAYAEYVAAPDYEDGLALAGEFENVLVTRTFSKIHGLAGLRLGWAYGPAAVIDALNRVRGPFNVAAPALAAGEAAIGDQDFPRRSAELNRVELARVSARLSELGLEPVPGFGNFVLVPFPRAPGREAAAADAHLRQRGLIVRGVGAYGLGHALRISIGAPDQNDRLLEALAEFQTAA